jgi:hypothetical protein
VTFKKKKDRLLDKTHSVRGTGIGHGVTSVSVGNKLKDKGTIAIGGPLLAECDRLLASKNVHAVDLETGNVLATLVVLGNGRRAVGGSTHAVLVVCKEEKSALFLLRFSLFFHV